jgi:hypothetical protein
MTTTGTCRQHQAQPHSSQGWLLLLLLLLWHEQQVHHQAELLLKMKCMLPTVAGCPHSHHHHHHPHRASDLQETKDNAVCKQEGGHVGTKCPKKTQWFDECAAAKSLFALTHAATAGFAVCAVHKAGTHTHTRV